MEAVGAILTVIRMHDDFDIEIEAIEDLDGAAATLFPRVFIGGESGQDARHDATALAAVLAEGAEAVTVPERAELIVLGSAADAAPGRAALDPADRSLVDGARCPVAVAPRGLADRDDYEPRRIDVGIDGSRSANAALAVAVRLALAHDARLRLIAVAALDFEIGGSPREADPREVERLSRRLGHAADGLPGIWVETDLREGLPDQILLGLGREADLLVLGSRALYGTAGQVALGDVAERVLRAAPCPTLVIPAP